MTVMQNLTSPFLDGKPKRMLIDGKWVEAASGKTFETINPATGERLAMVAEGDAEDVRPCGCRRAARLQRPVGQVQAVRAPGRAVEAADLVEQHFDELSLLDTLDMGAPISRTRANRLRALACCATTRARRSRSTARRSRTRCRGEYVSFTLKEAVGVVRRVHPVERADVVLDLEDRPGAGHRLSIRGAEAGRGSAADPACAWGACAWRPACAAGRRSTW